MIIKLCDMVLIVKKGGNTMITTVTLNPAIDRTILLKKLNIGQVNRVQRYREDMGGKGINVCRALTHLGALSCAIGFLGQDNLEKTDRLLKQEMLKTDFIMVPGNTRTNLKVLDQDQGITTEINESGFSVTSHHIEQIERLIQVYSKKSEFLLFCGSVPEGMSHEAYADLLERQAVNGVKRIIDAEGQLLALGCNTKPYLIKPNLFEFQRLAGQKLEAICDVAAAAKEIRKQYGIDTVLVSMGAKGAILSRENVCLLGNTKGVPIAGTVGAGDSLLGGYLYGLSSGMEEKQALFWGMAASAASIGKEGTESFSREEAEGLLLNVTVEEIQI